MTTNNQMPALPPLPAFPPAEQTFQEVIERLNEAKRSLRDRTITEQEMGDRTAERVIRSITGQHGWTAILFAANSRQATLSMPEAYALQNILEPLADWWASTVEDAVTRCPEPENAKRQSKTRYGANRILRTTEQWFSSTGDLILPSGEWHPVTIWSALEFDGKARPSDVIWPYHLVQITTVVVNAIINALGTVKVQTPRGEELQAAWQPFYTEPRRTSRKLRIFEDFSGKTPEERQIHNNPAPPPLKPSATWATRSHRLSGGICPGESCQYEQARTTTSRRMSGCDQAWRKHSEAVFEAFRNSNPDIQYNNRHGCVLDTEPKRHVCQTRNHRALRGHPLDHDELCRFPDGSKLMISHPYPHWSNDDFIGELEGWKREAPGLSIRVGGPEKSWYFPGHSSLVLIGNSAALERVNLDFQAPRGTEPIGCQRWRIQKDQQAHGN